MTLDFALNLLGLSTSLTAIYLTTLREEVWLRRLGCIVGIIGCFINAYLFRHIWSGLALNIAIGLLYIKGANIPGLIKKLFRSSKF